MQLVHLIISILRHGNEFDILFIELSDYVTRGLQIDQSEYNYYIIII